MLTQVAVVPLDDGEITLDDLLPIAEAIDEQVKQHLGRAWPVDAAVSALSSLQDVPPGTWPVAVTNRNDLPVDGFHFVMNGLPFAIVGNTPNLSVVLSHEIVEMLVDSTGLMTIQGPTLDPNAPPGTTVNYVAEVCDVCEGGTYQINRVNVSDFVVPAYYDMDGARDGGYSFTGALSAPRQVRTGGYITWREHFPSNAVYQAFALPALGPKVEGLRSQKLASVPNPGVGDPQDDTAAAGTAAADTPAATGSSNVQQAPVPNLTVLELPNSPTRAWRELIANLARTLEGGDNGTDATEGATAKDGTDGKEGTEVAEGTDDTAGQARPPVPQTSLGDDNFASTFRSNVSVLLDAMRHTEPPPSIPQILAAIENTEATKKSDQPTTDASANPHQRIIDWLKEQERLAPVLGPSLDPDLAMWMFMIMP